MIFPEFGYRLTLFIVATFILAVLIIILHAMSQEEGERSGKNRTERDASI